MGSPVPRRLVSIPSEPAISITVSLWSQQTGINFGALLKAASLAICCAGTLTLPDHFTLGTIPESRRRFTFEHLASSKSPGNLPSPAERVCKDQHASSDHFLYFRLPRPCQKTEIRAAAYNIAFAYSGLVPQQCGDDDDTATAHVRTLGMNASLPGVHTGYGQPPLSYYLSAWKHSGMRRLKVVYKSVDYGKHGSLADGISPNMRRIKGDDGRLLALGESPVVLGLKMLQHALDLPIEFQTSSDWATDLKTLMCARTIILSNSALNVIFLAAPHAQRAYEYGTPDRGPYKEMSHDCQLQRFHMSGKVISDWTASDTQKLQNAVEFRTTAFEPVSSLYSPQWAWCTCYAISKANCTTLAGGGFWQKL